MGKKTKRNTGPIVGSLSPVRSPSSASSSEFEFAVGTSPRLSSPNFCPADELFYKGQLLPLHHSTRLSVVRGLLLSSASSSSYSDTSRDSIGSSNSSLPESDSVRPSSVAEEEDLRRLRARHLFYSLPLKKARTFSFPRIFRKEKSKIRDQENTSSKRTTAKEVFCKCLKKVKPFYDKISQKQQKKDAHSSVVRAAGGGGGGVGVFPSSIARSEISLPRGDTSMRKTGNESAGMWSSSFSGNLRYPRKRNFVSSCPSSIRSSPNHSGLLSRTGSAAAITSSNSSSSMDELQHAIQGAIAYCKSSIAQSMYVASRDK